MSRAAVTVTVRVTADWQELGQVEAEMAGAGHPFLAQKLGEELRRFLADFRQQAEIWQREIQADPLLARVLRVEVGR